jgi:hypothetical protein
MIEYFYCLEITTNKDNPLERTRKVSGIMTVGSQVETEDVYARICHKFSDPLCPEIIVIAFNIIGSK